MSDTNISSLVNAGTARADIAAAVRAHIAVRRTNDSQVARAIGMSQAKFSRRTNEQVAFDADDLGRIANYFDIEVLELVQAPKITGGGTSFLGITPLHRPVVGRTGLEPVTDGSWVAPVTPITRHAS